MPLSNDRLFGVKPMTEAVNKLPPLPTTIRGLGIFTPKYLTTTHVDVELKNNALTLVEAVPRGAPGEPVAADKRNIETFGLLHLPKNDVVNADDVQNVRAFGSDNKTETVAEKVNDKLAAMKADIELTREHLMLGALLGKVMNRDGTTELLDIYRRFGLTRAEHAWALDQANTKVGQKIDATITALKKLKRGEAVSGWACLCSPEFMQALVYHDSIVKLYERFQDGKTYREGETNVEFVHKQIRFIQYDDDFGTAVKIKPGEAILLPLGTRETFREFFAPANYSETVNTKAQPYYAKREKMKFDKGWDMEAQSNPLPLVMRPELVATLKIS